MANSTYRVVFANGRKVEAESLDAAKDLVTAEYPDAEIGHDGDLENGGDRTLCWPDEESSVDDDGVSAIASIYRVDTDDQE